MKFLKSKIFYNLYYGKCIILFQFNDYYLVKVSKCIFNYKYIVCSYIDITGALMNQNFFDKFFPAFKFLIFRNLKIKGSIKKLTKSRSSQNKNKK